MKIILFFVFVSALLTGLNPAFSSVPTFETHDETTPIPAGVHDTDDPAIWLHPTTAGKSLIIGVSKNKKQQAVRRVLVSIIYKVSW